MAASVDREEQWAEELRLGVLNRDAMRRKARLSEQEKQFTLAGSLFAALATSSPEDANPEDAELALIAARNYEKGAAREDALRWYLSASERYALKSYPTKAVATLRLYHKLAPDEHEGPKRVFSLCRDMEGFQERLAEFLSPKERAGHHLRSQELFATFDDATFDDMLNAMSLHDLAADEVLVSKDDAASLFIVVEGRLDGYLMLDGVRSRIGSIHPAEMCGEIGYFLAGRRSPEVVAGEASRVLELPYSKLDELRDRAPDFGERLDKLYRARMLASQLAVTDFFSQLDVDLRSEIAGRMRPMQIRAGERLFDESESTMDVYVILAGELSAHLKLGGGRHMKHVPAGSVVGEFSVALGGKRTATLQAVSDCKLMCLPGDDYRELYDAEQGLRDVLAERKQVHMAETRDFIMGMDEDISDRICTAMLRTIWGPA